MSADVTLASVGSRIFDGVLGFLPDWIQITFVALVLLALVASWVMKIKRKIAHRRALRSGVPVQAAAQHGGRSGADYLGQYAPGAQQPVAPQQPVVPQQRSGADFLGSYAPQQDDGRRDA